VPVSLSSSLAERSMQATIRAHEDVSKNLCSSSVGDRQYLLAIKG
jgi:hypothetical protein